MGAELSSHKSGHRVGRSCSNTSSQEGGGMTRSSYTGGWGRRSPSWHRKGRKNDWGRRGIVPGDENKWEEERRRLVNNCIFVDF